MQGSDLYRDLPLAPWEAVLGATVAVRTLHGTVRIKIPPGTESGTEFRVRGKGLPAGEGDRFGDLYAVATVVFPSNPSPRERELWQQLQDESAFRPSR